MRISIALCTFNGEQYLLDQLQSFTRQTRLPDELIVTDDRSSDRTPEIVRRFAESAPFPVQLHINPSNLGSTRNFARAIGLCSGDIIALSDQDDVWYPQKLERFEKLFLTNPEVGLVFTDADIVDPDLRPLESHLWDWTFRKEERRLMKKGKAFEVLMQRNVVTGATMAFRSRFNELILPIPPLTSLLHDGWIAFIIASAANVIPLSEPLIKYRQHHGQQLGIRAIQQREEGSRPESTAAARARYYVGEIQKLQRFQNRLTEALDGKNKDFINVEARINMLQELSAHYRVRGNIPEKRWKRLSPISRELLTWRYHRYGNGLRSALLDAIR